VVIDHPAGKHDDSANAVAVLVAVLNYQIKRLGGWTELPPGSQEPRRKLTDLVTKARLADWPRAKLAAAEEALEDPTCPAERLNELVRDLEYGMAPEVERRLDRAGLGGPLRRVDIRTLAKKPSPGIVRS
jgi:hypothetical protein